MLRLEELGELVGVEVVANGRARGAVHVWQYRPEKAELLMDCVNILAEKERAAVVGKLPAKVQPDTRDVLERLAVKLYARQEEVEVVGEESDEGSSLFPDSVDELWPAPVDGELLLDEIVGALKRYLVLPPGGADACGLWCLHAHAHDAADVSPLLALTSPEKRCGKTHTLQLVGAIAPRPLAGTNITAAAVFRTVEAWRPTLLIDEADTFLGEREELRGVLNASHDRGSAKVVRLEKIGEAFEPRAFSTWCPKAVAMIGELPDTLADRSIHLVMRRRAPGETVERFRLDRLTELQPLRQQAARWARDNSDRLRESDPQTPAELHDRAADNWRPLLAIADAVGGTWPLRARRAALTLHGHDSEESGDSPGTLLLSDLRRLFVERNADRLQTAEIVKELVEMESRPWPEWSHGDPLSPRALARLLKPFGIEPHTIRGGGTKFKGYLCKHFIDAWSRYLPPVSVASVASLQDNDLEENLSVAVTSSATDRKSANSLYANDVTDATDTKGATAALVPGDAYEGPEDA